MNGEGLDELSHKKKLDYLCQNSVFYIWRTMTNLLHTKKRIGGTKSRLKFPNVIVDGVKPLNCIMSGVMNIQL
ncbi:hypothetical protein D1872_302390 [compost metagenome]